jgi:hypothetical protein
MFCITPSLPAISLRPLAGIGLQAVLADIVDFFLRFLGCTAIGTNGTSVGLMHLFLCTSFQ